MASAEALRKALVGLWAWGRHHTVAVVDSPEVGNLDLGADILDLEEDPEAGSHDPGVGSLGLGEGRLVHLHSSHQKARDRQDRHRREQRGNLS